MTTVRKIRDLLTASERRGAVALLGLMLIGMALETAGIGLVIPATAILIQSDLAAKYPQVQPILNALGNPSHARLVAGGMLALVAVFLTKAAFVAFLTWRQMRFAFSVQVQLSQRLFTTYLRQPYTFHLQRNSAQLILNVVNEVSVFTFNAMLPALLLLTEVLVILGIGSLLLIVEPGGTLLVALLMGSAAWGFHRILRPRIDRSSQSRQHHDGLRIQHLQQGLGGAKEVKLLGREDDFVREFRLHNVQSAHVGELQMTLREFPRLWLELLGVVALATLVLSALARGRDVASIVPALALFSAAAFRLMPSVNRMMTAVQSLRYALPVLDTLHEELKLASPEPLPKGAPGPAFHSEIRLSGVSYSYPGTPALALSDLGITIRKGESVGFVGHSGAGKSTLVDVILGLLTPTSGHVLVDGRDIQHDLRAWQDQVGYVPQSIYLTDDTLRRNVAFGLPGQQIDEVAVRRAIHAAQLDAFVAGLPDGLETVIGERGVRLSGGQRQRIGIARALYHDPPVLVLDEATSALDGPTEAGVMQAVMALQRSKTIIVVAHRLSTVEHCDRLYRLEHGRVAAEGATAEMLQAQRVV